MVNNSAIANSAFINETLRSGPSSLDPEQLPEEERRGKADATVGVSIVGIKGRNVEDAN